MAKLNLVRRLFVLRRKLGFTQNEAKKRALTKEINRLEYQKRKKREAREKNENERQRNRGYVFDSTGHTTRSNRERGEVGQGSSTCRRQTDANAFRRRASVSKSRTKDDGQWIRKEHNGREYYSWCKKGRV